MRRRDFLGGLTLAASGCASADPASLPAPHEAAASPAPAPAGFFAALRRLQNGTTTSPVSILQIGDSHTANDGFSGRMRELMQQRFGNAGRGLLPPGIPFRLYRADGVQVSADGFEVISSFRRGAEGPFGISGLRQHGMPGASMVLKVERPGDLASVEIAFLARPGAGTARIVCDNGPALTVPTTGADPAPRFVQLSAPEATQMSVSVSDGAIDMMSWRVRRAQPGVTWSNLGTIGATVSLLERWDPAFVQAELAHENPALIVLAFGSNEGFADDTDLERYAGQYRAAIALLQRGAPGASLLLIGPPDGVRHPVPGMGKLCAGGTWQTPPNLARVRQLQAGVARELGLPFWDWSAPMGGVCSMVDWAAQTPPLASPDHLHLLHAGYRRTAESLFADLMRGYDAYLSGTTRH
jgi:lysophospholipase L1-like esterase